ncbi:hypothetical protein O1L60_41640 [Streptomyces diastatochromogenes]|nr:hypothetical protein [Streptomyces diastatochromogenes]
MLTDHDLWSPRPRDAATGPADDPDEPGDLRALVTRVFATVPRHRTPKDRDLRTET